MLFSLCSSLAEHNCDAYIGTTNTNLNGLNDMMRRILNAAASVMIALAPVGLASGISIFTPVSVVAQNVEPAIPELKKNVKSARKAFKAAKKALAKAKKKNKNVEEAKQAFDIAKLELDEATDQLKQARAQAKANKQNKAPQTATTQPEPDQQEPQIVTTDPEEQEPVVTKKKRKKRKKKALANITPPGPVAPPTPSPEAPQANKIADAPIESQIKKAEETAIAVVPDNITKSQRDKIRAAEKKRRKKAKKQRRELLGAVAVGAVVGALLPELGGTVVQDQGDRLVVERGGKYYVRKDESALFRDGAQNVVIKNLKGGRTLETVYRRDGSRIETLRNAGGYILRRVRINRNNRRVVLFDSGDFNNSRRVDYDRELPPIRLQIPHEEYEVSGGRVGRRSLTQIFGAPPVERVQRQYSLRDIRESRRLRSIVRSVDLDTITFDSGSAAVRQSQISYLADIAGSMFDTIYASPQSVFLIEGHTDAVGSEISNLTLSDRRAETVARILVQAFDVPPENLVTQGYGEQYLKIGTLADERRNRRVTVRNITPLLTVR